MLGTVGTMITGWAFLTAGLVMIYLADFHQFVRRAAGAVPPVTDLLDKFTPPPAPQEEASKPAKTNPEPVKPDPVPEPPKPAPVPPVAPAPSAQVAMSRLDQLRAAMAEGTTAVPTAEVPEKEPELFEKEAVVSFFSRISS